MRKSGSLLLVISLISQSGCSGDFPLKRPLAAKQKPVQVVYRFDDHRWLELKGFNCQGELWYVDQKREIQSQVFYQFYRIFTRPYFNVSERYIAIPIWGEAGLRVSNDYGQTWHSASIAGEEDDGSNKPDYENIKSFTVVNDQGFLLTKQGHIYMSSLPFDDPRLGPGGPGIDYSFVFRGKIKKYHIDAVRPGVGEDYSTWGLEYIDPRILEKRWAKHLANFQNLPDKVPEVKNYRGWTHMQCDVNAGL
ncbi:T6SS immunity protein Tli3 family protein [Erwinia typographi]